MLLNAVVRMTRPERSDRFVLAAALGFGTLGLGLFVLGVLGGFRPGWIAIALSAAGYVVFGGSTDPILELRAAARMAPASWQAPGLDGGAQPARRRHGHRPAHPFRRLHPPGTTTA